MMKSNVVKLLALVLPLVIFLTGCTDAKSYYYYMNHPAELEMDYKFCADNPGRTMCDGIITKYVKYHKALSEGQARHESRSRAYAKNNEVENTGAKVHNVRQVSVFADLDKTFEEVYL
jgi:hypothetical protein